MNHNTIPPHTTYITLIAHRDIIIIYYCYNIIRAVHTALSTIRLHVTHTLNIYILYVIIPSNIMHTKYSAPASWYIPGVYIFFKHHTIQTLWCVLIQKTVFKIIEFLDVERYSKSRNTEWTRISHSDLTVSKSCYMMYTIYKNKILLKCRQRIFIHEK